MHYVHWWLFLYSSMCMSHSATVGFILGITHQLLEYVVSSLRPSLIDLDSISTCLPPFPYITTLSWSTTSASRAPNRHAENARYTLVLPALNLMLLPITNVLLDSKDCLPRTIVPTLLASTHERCSKGGRISRPGLNHAYSLSLSPERRPIMDSFLTTTKLNKFVFGLANSMQYHSHSI
jgi:hypothetical protein